MAYKLNIDGLDQPQRRMLAADLVVTPSEDQKDPNAVTRTPLRLYAKEEDHVKIPMAYAVAKAREIGLDVDFINPMSADRKTALKFVGEMKPEQNEVLDSVLHMILRSRASILAARPGFGKTVLSVKIATELGTRTLVVMTKKTLIDSWLKTVETFSPDARVMVVGEKDKIDKQISGEIPDIILSMEQRVVNLPEVWRESIGLLVVDEAHEFCTQLRLNRFFGLYPTYFLACTATPAKADGTFSAMNRFAGNEAVWKKTVPSFLVYRLPTGFKPVIQRDMRGQIDWNKIVNSLSENEARSRFIVDLVLSLPTDKILILTSRVAHTKVLHTILGEVGVTADYMAGNKTSYSDSRVLIGTVSKLGTGFDEARACKDFSGIKINLLIVAYSTKCENLIEQTSGRVFRHSSPSIVYLVDDCGILENHWRVAARWYRSRGGDIRQVRERRIEDIVQDLNERREDGRTGAART